MAFRILGLMSFLFLISGCISSEVRLPSSVRQVYKNDEIQQSLMLAAQNNILFYIPDTTVRDVEKTEVLASEQKCQTIEEPMWAERLALYLHEFQKRPEFLNRFHILEMKRTGDQPQIQVQKDLDGAVTLSIQYVKIESYGKVTYQTNLPCSGNLADFQDKKIVKTDFEFPTVEQFNEKLNQMTDRTAVPRFQFDHTFLSYLAERGIIFKFNHEMSFEKLTNGKYVFADLMQKYSEQSKEPFHQHINYWFKNIFTQSTQARLIQMFGLVTDKELKYGVKVDSNGEHARRVLGEPDLTYLFTSYFVENEKIQSSSLQQLDNCLQKLTVDMGGVRLRKPAATEPDSYLRPGYLCSSVAEN